MRAVQRTKRMRLQALPLTGMNPGLRTSSPNPSCPRLHRYLAGMLG
jgi:hypothetical protein